MWPVSFLDDAVEAELHALPADQIGHFFRIAEMIEQLGLGHVGRPHIKHVEGKLWEMRLKGRDGISRALYVTALPKRLIVLRIFVKKTQKTPLREIRTALKRAASVE